MIADLWPWPFAHPLWLLLLLALPVIAWIRMRRRVPVLAVPYVAQWFRGDSASLGNVPAALLYAGVVLLIVAMARPQKLEAEQEIERRGYDIVLAIDLSGSMLAEDYGQGRNRIGAVKPVVEAFIRRRENDRIGIVVFAGRAYTLAPLTFDHEWLLRQMALIEVGPLEDGTAIGDGLGTALARLEPGERPEEIERRHGAFVVLLTDGSNNQGALDPLAAADLAKARGIPVFTIGAGKDGWTIMPIFDENRNLIDYRRARSDIDEETLREMARRTGAKFYRARDPGSISAAFSEIDRQKKIDFESQTYQRAEERFAWFAWPGALLIAAAALSEAFRRELSV